MQTILPLLGSIAAIGAGLSWIAALFFYVRIHRALGPDQAHLRGQLVFNWLFAHQKLTGEAREHAGNVHRAMAAFFVCMIAAAAAFALGGARPA